MKTLLILLLLACGLAMAQDCADRPRLTITPQGRVQWGPTFCPLWVVEVSDDLRDWVDYYAPRRVVCDYVNGQEVNCIWSVPLTNRPQFYRLRLAPGL